MSIDTNLGNPTIDIIAKLQASNISFSATGSRFFKHCRPLSDWDFYTPNVESTKSFLTSIGFKKVDVPNYYIPFQPGRRHPNSVRNNVEEVWCHSVAHVHVQFVKDYELRQKVHEVLKESDIIPILAESMGKDVMKLFWNAFLDLAAIQSVQDVKNDNDIEAKIEAEVKRRVALETASLSPEQKKEIKELSALMG